MRVNKLIPRHPPALHPFLVGSLFVLGGYREARSFVSLGEMFLNLGVVLACVLLLYLLLKRLVKTPFRASALATLFVTCFCFFHYFRQNIEGVLRGLGLGDWIRPRVVPTIVLAVFVTLMALTLRATKPLRLVKAFLNAAAGLALAVTLVQLLVWPGPRQAAHFPPRPEFRPPEATLTNAPDIYFLIMDSHTSLAALQEYWGYDSAEFAGFLRRGGFIVVTNGVSAYAGTSLCMASTFNMAPVPDPLTNSAGYAQYGRLAREIRASFVPRQFRSMGYEVVNLSPFAVLDRPPFYYYPFMNAARLHSVLLEESLVSFPWRFVGMPNLDQVNRDILARLEDLAARPGERPRFVYAHLMMPHFPLFFDRDGRPQPRPFRNDYSMQDYLEYLIYSDRAVTNLLDRLTAPSGRPSLVILQGDHGFREVPEPLRVREATRILMAFHLPGGPAPELHAGMAAIDTFPFLFNRCFGTAFPMTPMPAGAATTNSSPTLPARTSG